MVGVSRRRAILALSASFIIFAFSTRDVAAQETCKNVTVSGELAGDYDQGEKTTLFAKAETAHVLQVVSFGGGDSVRRAMAETDGTKGALWGEGRRGLVNDCESQMWILTNTSEVVDGYPYYAAFDCAEHPADVNSTWIYIECDDCAEVASVSIACASNAVTNPDSVLRDASTSEDDDNDDDDSIFTIPVISGIAAAAVLIIILCVGFFVLCRKKKGPTGSQTFADDSEHNPSLKRPQVVGTSVPQETTLAISDPSHKGPSVGEETATNPIGPPYASAKHAKNLKKGQDITDNSVYGSLHGSGASGGRASRHESRSASSRQPSRAESMERSVMDTRKDSMAEAAAAAHAARSKAMGIEMAHQQKRQQPIEQTGVLRTGAIERRPPGDGSGVKWSAGQNFEPRGAHDDGAASQFSDSAAGSVFSIYPPLEDAVQQHTYDYDDSVAASSPDAYSMYSHFTAGGNTYMGGASEYASDAEGDTRRMVLPPPSHGFRGKPPAYVDPPAVVLDSPISRNGPSEQAADMDLSMSPAGLAARADRNSSRRYRKSERRAQRVKDVTR